MLLVLARKSETHVREGCGQILAFSLLVWAAARNLEARSHKLRCSAGARCGATT